MNFFESIIHALEATGTKQVSFGWYHIMCALITLAVAIFFCVKFKNATSKQNNIILLVFWIVIVVLEIYKQLVHSFSLVNGVPIWDYQWYIFPYQLCSTPLYVLPLILLIKNEKVKDALYSYMSCFALFGGLCVMIFPNDVFNTAVIGVMIQTMVHHGIMVVLGCYLFVYNRKKLNIKYYLKGLIVFAIVVSIAFILNESLYPVLSESFNMFYISRHYGSSLPVLNMLFPILPYWLFVIVYVFGFALIGLILFGIAFGVYKLSGFIQNKHLAKNVISEGQVNGQAITNVETNTEQNDDKK